MADPAAYDLVAHLARQRDFSLRAFGPLQRVAGRLDHLRKELAEIEASGGADPAEWVDVALLAFDGLLRIPGVTPELAAAALRDKLARNEARQWPDWRTADPDRAIEHTAEGAP